MFKLLNFVNNYCLKVVLNDIGIKWSTRIYPKNICLNKYELRLVTKDI